MSEAVLELEGVYLRYLGTSIFASPGSWVLKGIDFQLTKGECVGLIGANGSGKSTLLRVCSGILAPCKGKVTLAKGYRWPQLLSLNAGFEPQLNARDNLMMMGLLMGCPKKSLEERIPELLRWAGLEEVAGQALATFSHGMKARLGFAMALEGKSEILCIDEILSVGDATFRALAEQRLKTRLDEGASGFLATHQPAVLMPYCRRTIWLEGGRIRKVGPTAEVVNEYSAWAKEQARQKQALIERNTSPIS